MLRIIDNCESYANALQQRSAVLTRKLLAAVNGLTIRMQAKILNRPDSPASSSHRRKGWLSNSIRPIPATSDGTQITGGVEGAGGDAWYGRLFEEGSFRAYPIVAANRKALSLEMNGQALLLKSVVHPAFNPVKLAFMRPVADEMHDEIRQTIQRAAMEGISGE